MLRLDDMYLSTVSSTVPGGRIDPLDNVLVSHTTHVVCVYARLYVSGETYTLTSTPNISLFDTNFSLAPLPVGISLKTTLVITVNSGIDANDIWFQQKVTTCYTENSVKAFKGEPNDSSLYCATDRHCQIMWAILYFFQSIQELCLNI